MIGNRHYWHPFISIIVAALYPIFFFFSSFLWLSPFLTQGSKPRYKDQASSPPFNIPLSQMIPSIPSPSWSSPSSPVSIISSPFRSATAIISSSPSFTPVANPPSRCCCCTPTSSIGELWQPGQLCTTSCAKTSQSMQKCMLQVSHAYRPDSLTPLFVDFGNFFLGAFFVGPRRAVLSLLLSCDGDSLESFSVVKLAVDEGGGKGNDERHPQQAECRLLRASSQETSLQFLNGKRWW